MRDVDLEIETLGLKCPLPVLRVKKRTLGLPAGSRVRVIADDPTTQNDLPAWCALAGHQLIDKETFEDPHRFVYHLVMHGSKTDNLA